MGTDVDAVADELYALHPTEFVAARDAKAKAARASGDKDAAREITSLRRPTVVAWLANLLSRQRADAVRPLLELGAALREATETLSGPELRELSRQRNELVNALVREARSLSAAAGQRRLGEDAVRGLEATLHAALADPEAAERLIEGRLTDGLTHTGFATAAPAAASHASTSPAAAQVKGPAAERSPQDERRAAQRAKLEEELGTAWTEAGQATERRDAADDDARRSERSKAEAAREVARLRGELDSAEEELRRATEAHDAAVALRQQADREARRARQRVAALQARLDKL